MSRVLVILVLIAACRSGTHRDARVVYNEGVAALAASKWAEAEAAFLRARSEAGVDPELRWRAAFDLGLAHAGHAAEVAAAEPPDLEQAHELYGKAAGWFQDAIRLEDDPDARANLEIARARQQAIADQLVAGQKALEAKLDQLIAGQREIRDRARALLEQARAGAAVSPTALEDAARTLATAERVLLADAGVVADLAGSEVATIEAKPEDQRTPEDQQRMAQLGVLEPWVQIARTALADTRRMLDEGKHETSHARAEDAVDALKRARETLLDPTEVLRAIAQDELEVAQQTGYLERAAAEAVKIDGQPQPVPAWLTTAHLGGRQHEVRSRLDETKAMLAAATSQPPAAADDPQAAAQARTLARVKAALPDLEAASAAMARSNDALTTNDLALASAAQLEAILALGRAMEQFMALRGLLELTWQQQRQIVAMLAGEGEVAAMPPAERSKQVRDGLERNLARVARFPELLVEEKEQLAAAAAQAQDPAADPQVAAQQQQQTEQLFAQAEVLRGQALAALEELAAGKGKRAPIEPARDAEVAITELRKLFFSIIEHLKELIRVQGETRDDSTEVAGQDDLGRAPLLPGLIGRQGEHLATAQAIAEALAAQADAPPPPQPQPGAPDPAKLGEAAEEVRAAAGDMEDASGLFTKANDPATTMSVDLAPALESQQSAITHLEAALRLLQPPDQQQQQQDQQDQQDQQQQDQQDQQDQSVDRRREQVREQEAQRRREREQRQRAEDPVEKDW